MYLGSHVSIRKGYLEAAKTALHIGARAYQYFPKNPRSLALKTFDRSDAEACAKFCRAHDLLSIAHAPYPTNLAVDDKVQRQVIIQSILNDLSIVEACGSVGLVVHFGKYKGKDPLQGYKNSLQCLNEVLSEWSGNALILIENQAGEGTRMGTTFEEFVQIRSLAAYPEQIGFCFDTCHAFASGLWTEDNWLEIVARGEELDYFAHLKAVHLNDSMFPSGSYRDRHANVGKGFIGQERMAQFLKTSYMQSIPIVLETPESHGFTHQDELTYVNSLYM
jgi:deoxyribonuclease-4